MAYAVGFGGSMIRFGSTSGVAVRYVLGFAVMLAVLGFHGHPIRPGNEAASVTAAATAASGAR